MTSTSRCIGWLLVLVGAACARASASDLPFIQDNYPKALLVARQRQLPIFVEVWAPW
jgi:hypothetical protein